MIPYVQSKIFSWKLLPIVLERFSQIIGGAIRYYFYFFAFKKIGRWVYISRNVSFGGLYNIELGNKVAINQGCNIYGDFGITIGDNTKLSPYVQVYSANYKYRRDTIVGASGVTGKEVTIGDNVWVGAGSIILPGVNIGDNSIIGALSLVNKNIPRDEIWAGNPARFVKKI